MATIDHKGPLYRLAYVYVTHTFKQFYSEFYLLGKENLPADGKAIYGSNHLNALMDALAMLSIVPRPMSIVFLARADIFGNKLAARLLHFTKIFPAYRIRNGFENLGKNAEVFEQCADVLNRGNCIGIMPEGNQTLQHKIRPLVKGIFRIAFAAQEKLGEEESIKLIPIGIDMVDLIMPGSPIVIEAGKPINVLDYMKLHKEDPVLAMNRLRADYRQALRDVTVDYATDEHYDTFELTGLIVNTEMVNHLNIKDNTVNRFKARKEIAKRLVAIEREKPEKLEELTATCKDFQQNIKAINLSIPTLEKAPESPLMMFLRALLLAIASPIALVGSLLNALPYFGTRGISKALNFNSDEFFSSVHYFLGILITFPIFYIINTVLFACFTDLAWWWTVVFFFAQYPFGRFAFFWFKRLSKLGEKLRYRSIAKKQASVIDKVNSLRKQLVDLVLG